ncbi:hypothetical protein [Bacillus sp. FJAT-45037]|uniref:hypothetical protein n=1 Tax=Bacillus sp. FJAT-45037 TaxID=2011007 RepID=UPI000C2340C6|nr:hypothetical protein [Bacillus sp. FJAT-45037]
MVKKLATVVLMILCTLLLGSLFGVQHMNEELGITTPVPLQLKATSEKQAAQTDIGPAKDELNVLSKSELKEKRQKVEEVGKFNFFSELGSTVAEGANRLSRTALSQVMSFVHEVLNGESRSG